jgi:hypothetical protein
MGKSCVYYDETIDQYRIAMDNLVIAKKLYDLGRKLPGNYVFTTENSSDRHASFFLFGLEILTGCETEILQDYGDEYSFLLEIPEAVEWGEIEGSHPDAENDREWICEPITNEELWSEYTEEVRVEMELLSGIGFAFQVYGVGCHYEIFEKICECYFRLQQKIAEWGERKEKGDDRTTKKRDNHPDSRERAGQYEISSCPEAG